MSQTWTVIINRPRSTGGPPQLDPDVFGTDPGQPLKAQVGDLVCWNNQTYVDVGIKVENTDKKNYFYTNIRAFESSDGYVIQEDDIHTDETTGDKYIPYDVQYFEFAVDQSTMGRIMVTS